MCYACTCHADFIILQVENHPVIRTLYDHLDSITALSFHPVTTHLVSGSKDCTVKIFDFTKVTKIFDLTKVTLLSDLNCLLNVNIITTFGMLQFFDFFKTFCVQASVKKAIKSVDEGAAIRCMSFHQSGDYLLIANDHPVIRMYDYETLKVSF